MQLKALPGQPVCKHSVSMCFGRAPAPRAHSNSSGAGEGAPRLPLLGRAALDRGVWGQQGPTSHPSLDSRRGQGSGLGAGRLQFHAEFHPQPHFGCNSWLFLAARRSLGCVPWQRGRRSALGCLVGRFSGPEPLSCLLQAWPQAGQPHRWGYFGLSAWSWVSSAWASPGVADLSSTKKPGRSVGCAEPR